MPGDDGNKPADETLADDLSAAPERADATVEGAGATDAAAPPAAAVENAAVDVVGALVDDDNEVAGGTPEQLGFDLRFEAGKALLALEDAAFTEGVAVKKALFEVPDVAFPLDVSGGALRFQGSRLRLRAIELGISYSQVFVSKALEKAGLKLHRERMRGGGIEFLLSTKGADGDVPFRAHVLFVPAGDAGVALVLHELIPFAPLPQSRRVLAPRILNALDIPGGLDAVGMMRRADPFAAVLKKLLPAYGWKVPSVDAVRVDEVLLKRGEILLRAWTDPLPEGWKKPRRQARAALKDALALAVFARELVEADGSAGRVALVDRLVDDGAVSPAVVPFAAEVLRETQRRAAEADILVDKQAELHPEHLGVLSAALDTPRQSDDQRAARLTALAEAADLNDEVWVASRAWLSAAQHLLRAGRDDDAQQAALEAFDADPTFAEAAALHAQLLLQGDDFDAALKVASAAADRLVDDDDDVAQLCLAVAEAAMGREAWSASREWLYRGMRDRDREPLLHALVKLEVRSGEFDRAAELLARLLVLDEEAGRSAAQKAAVQELAADLAVAQGDRTTAKAHFARAAKLAPLDENKVLPLARMHLDDGELQRALDVLAPVLDEDQASTAALWLGARTRLGQGTEHGAKRALALLDRVGDDDAATAEHRRLQAKAQALQGDVLPLAEQTEAEAQASGDAADWLAAFGLLAQAGQIDRAHTAFTAARDAWDVGTVADALNVSPEPAALRGKMRAGVDDDWCRALARQLASRGLVDEALAWVDGLDDDDDHRFIVDVAETDALLPQRTQALTALAHRDSVGDDEKRGVWAALAEAHSADGAWRDAALAASEAVAMGADLVDRWGQFVEEAQEADLAVAYLSNGGTADALSMQLLRDTRNALEADGANAALRAMLASVVVEGRDDDADGVDANDVDALARAQRDLHPTGPELGVALADLAVRFARADWLREGVALLIDSADVDGAATWLRASLQTSIVVDAARFALDQADALQLPALVQEAGAALLDNVPEQGRPAAFTRWLDAASIVDEAAALDVAQAWLAEAPGAWRPAQHLLGAVDAHWLPELLRSFADTFVASSAQQADEVVAAFADTGRRAEEHESVLLDLAMHIAEQTSDKDAVRAPLLERQAHRAFVAGELEEAALLLHSRIDCGDPGRFEAWVQMGEWLRDDDKHASDAIAAFAEALHLQPDASDVSEQLLELLLQHNESAAAEAELQRRAQLAQGTDDERQLWRRLGDLQVDVCAAPERGVRSYLKSLRMAPLQEDLLDVVAALSRALPNAPRRMVQVHLAALRGAGDDDATASHYAIEAGALFAGLLQRRRAALAAYRVAQVRGQGGQAESACWASVELYRSLGDVEGALSVLEDLEELVNEPRVPDVLDVKAGVVQSMQRDLAAARAMREDIAEAWPAHRANALHLERLLQDLGEAAEAFDVRAKVADLDEDPEFRVQSWLLLAERAETELDVPRRAMEMLTKVVGQSPNVASYRLQRIALAERLAAFDLIVEDVAAVASAEVVPVADRIALQRKRADILADELHKPADAIEVLREVLLLRPDRGAHRKLVELLVETGDPDAAIAELGVVLDDDNSAFGAFGSAREVLEWQALLHEGQGRLHDGYEVLCEAAALGRLSDGSALRFARLAEAEGDDVNALTALEWILDGEVRDPEHRLSSLGRQALIAERVGRLDLALSSWQRRAERLPNDLPAWLGIERMGQQLEEHDARRQAARALLRLGQGQASDRGSRSLFLARDGRDRKLDVAVVLDDYRQACLELDQADLRREWLAFATAHSDDESIFLALDTMRRQGDRLDDEEWLQSAQASAHLQRPRRALESALQALERGADADGGVMGVLERVAPDVQAALGLAVVNRLHRTDERGQGIVARLLPYVTDVAALPAEVVVDLAEAYPEEERFAAHAAQAAHTAGDTLQAVDRLLRLAEARSDDEAQAMLSQAADWLLETSPDVGVVMGRLDALLSVWAAVDKHRNEVLRVLRDAEAWPAVVKLLERAVDVTEDAVGRQLRLELVDILRVELEDNERAAEHLERLIARQPDDREAWGALLETLDDLEDHQRLADALGRRASLTKGIEQRELVRRRVELSLEHGFVGDGLVEQVASLRDPDAPTSDFDQLYWDVLAAQGTMTLRRALFDEATNGTKSAVRQVAARRLLQHPLFGSLPRSERVDIRLVAVGTDGDEAQRNVDALLASTATDAPDEAEAFVRLLPESLHLPLVHSVLLSDGLWGSRALLDVAERWFAAGIATDDAQAVLSSAARALRVRSPAAAQSMLLHASELDDDEVASSVHRALRRHAVDEVVDHVTSASLDEKQADDMAQQLGLDAGPALAGMTSAWSTTPAWVAAAIRAERDDAERLLLLLDDDAQAALARQLGRLEVTPERLGALLTLADTAPDTLDAARAEALARCAVDEAHPRRLQAVDRALSHAAEGAEPIWAVAAKARALLDVNDAEAPHWCVRAARLQDAPEWWQEAASAWLRIGAHDEAADVLREWGQAQPASMPLALELARAAGLHDLVDQLLAQQGAGDVDAKTAREAALARAEHKLTKLHDALGAFETLADAADARDDDDLREAAYVLSVREGLLQHRPRVTTDALAKAATLASLARPKEALACLNDVTNVAALRLAADLHLQLGDVDATTSAWDTICHEQPTPSHLQKRFALRRTSSSTKEAWRELLQTTPSPEVWGVLRDTWFADFGDGCPESLAQLWLTWVQDDTDPRVAQALAQDTNLPLAVRLQTATKHLQDAATDDTASLARQLLSLLGEAGGEGVDDVDAGVTALWSAGVDFDTHDWRQALVHASDACVEALADQDARLAARSALLSTLVARQLFEAAAMFLDDDTLPALPEFDVADVLAVAEAAEHAPAWLTALARGARVDTVADWLTPAEQVRAWVHLHLQAQVDDAAFWQAAAALRDVDDDGARRLLAQYALRLRPTEQSMWTLLADQGDAHFEQQLHLANGGEEGALGDTADWQALAALRDEDAAPAFAPQLSWRHLSAASRARRWQTQAAALAQSAPQTAFRFLARAGQGLDDVDVHTRLALDPQLQSSSARATFVADQLMQARQEDPVDDDKLSALQAVFADLAAKGHTTALQRVEAQGGSAADWDGALDLFESGVGLAAADALALVRPTSSAGEKRVDAAHLRHVGLGDVAAAMTSSPALSDASEASSAVLALTTGTTTDREEQLRAQLHAGSAAWDASLGRQLALGASPEDRQPLWRQRLHNADNGRRLLLLEAAATDLQHVELAEEWLDAARQADAHAAVIRAAQLLFALVDDGARRRSLALQLARTCREHLQWPAVAWQWLLQHLDDIGRDAVILEELSACADAAGRRREAAEALKRALDALDPADPKRREARLRAARQFEDAGDALEAASLLQAAVEEGDLSALDDLARLCEQHPLAEAQTLVLQHRLGVAEEGQARRDAALALARHLAHPIGRKGDALAVLERQAVSDANDRQTRLVLGRWYQDERRMLDAALAFESAAHTGDRADEEAIEAAAQAARLLSAIGNLERAGPLATHALKAGLDELGLYAVAEAWCRAQGEHGDLDELLGRELSHISDARHRALVWMERARIRSDELNDEEGAHQALLECLQARPDHAEAIERLKVFADENDKWAEYRAVLSRAVEVSDDDVRRVLWLKEMALVDGERLGDQRAAQSALAKAAELEPESADLWLKQAQLLLASGSPEGIPALLDKARALGDVHVPARLCLAEGDVLLLAGERDKAKGAFEQAALDAEVGPQAWERLIDLVEGGGNAVEIAGTLKSAREQAADDVVRLALARKEAVAWKKAGDDDRAMKVWEFILDHEPTADDALDVLHEHYARKRKLDVFAGKLRIAADLSADTEAKSTRLGQLGALLQHELGAESQARKVFEEALLLDDTNAKAQLGLARILFRAQDHASALPLLDQVAPDAWGDEVELLYARATTAQALQRDDVEERLRAVLRVAPQHVGALERLAAWAKDHGDVSVTEFALESLCSALDERENPTKLAFALVDLSAARREQQLVDAAVVSIERAHQLEPTSKRVLQEMVEVRRQQGQPALLLTALKALGPFVDDDARPAYMRDVVHALHDHGQLEESAEAAVTLVLGPHTADDIAFATSLAQSTQHTGLLQVLGLEPDAPEETTRTPAAPSGVTDEAPPAVDVTDAEPPAPEAPRPVSLGEPDAPASPTPPAEGPREDPGIVAKAFAAHGRVSSALDILQQGVEDLPERIDLIEQGYELARDGGTPAHKLFFGERQLKLTDAPTARLDAALMAGRAARDDLDNPLKAAELLFEAHQAAPENLDLRVELTELYASIDRLLPHAQTGVVQLLKRAPTDERVYGIATRIARASGIADKRACMLAAELMLAAKPLTAEVAPPGPLLPHGDLSSMSEADLAKSLAPPSYLQARDIGELVRVVGGPLETRFVENVGLLTRSKRLADQIPSAVTAMERIDRLLPGRPLKILVGPVHQVQFHPGGVLHAVLPETIRKFGEAVVVAFLARTYATARLGGVIADECPRQDMPQVRRLMSAALLRADADDGFQEKASSLLLELDADVQTRALTLSKAALDDERGQGGRDLIAWRDGVRILADRFALLVSGSLPGALAAGALPALLSEPPAVINEHLLRSERAIDLCRFAAGTEVWALRRKLKLLP